jgi:hypothetical protein
VIRTYSLLVPSAKPADLVVYMPHRSWACTECGDRDGWLMSLEEGQPFCLDCVDMGHLVFLPAGDAALSRRARAASSLSAVVIKFSRARKRYERQGLLVEEEALARAEEQCLSDEAARLRRRERDRERRAEQDVVFVDDFAARIVRLFPGCPPRRAALIAAHAGLRGSGRVGRSAAGRALEEDAVTLAVIASVRHEDTDYDALLMAGLARAEARDRVRPAVDKILEAWRLPTGP